MSSHVAAIFRHPVKGFTPEALTCVDVAPGEGFPHDRVYAVENGPSGFDPEAPAFTPKQKFTVLANLPQVARARTRYDGETGRLEAVLPGAAPFSGSLAEPQGRAAFAAWLAPLVGEDARGPLRVMTAPGAHRFTDHPRGQVSIINLASIRDLSRRIGREVDPLRFRANLYVEGWEPWAELDWTGLRLMAGWAGFEVFKPIVRCAAINACPDRGVRDLDLTKALFDQFGHMNAGVYVHVTSAGRIGVGDAATTPQVTAPQVTAPQSERSWA